LIGLVVWAIVQVTSTIHQPDRTGRQTAQDILDRRFAAGEIDVETYRAATRELSTPGRG
jgi:putative membrane protein